MSDKERPPVIRRDAKSLYIIDGSKKKRIYHNANKQSQTVNLILDSCVTNEKRKHKERPAIKRVEPTIEQIAANPNSQLNHLIRDKDKRITQLEQLAATRQAVNAITKNPTDNSLAAIERNGTVQTVAEQILTPQANTNVSGMSRLVPDTARLPVDEKNAGEPDVRPAVVEEPQIEVDDNGAPMIPGENVVGQQLMQDTGPTNVVDNSDINNEELQQIADNGDVKVQEPKHEVYYYQMKANTFLTRLDEEKVKELAVNFGLKTEGKTTTMSRPGQKIDIKKNDAKEYLLEDANFITTYTKAQDEAEAVSKYATPQYENIRIKLLGRGRTSSLMTGLYNDQIDDQLHKCPEYVGCVSRDEISKLQLDDSGKYGFVYNTVPSNKDTSYDGHWRAIFIDLDNGKSIDHYDSYGMEAEPDIQEQVASLLKSFDLPYYLKWKDNRIVNQRANSSNCGWFSIQFLQDRFDGKPFVDATGYSTVDKSERALKKRFGYLM